MVRYFLKKFLVAFLIAMFWFLVVAGFVASMVLITGVMTPIGIVAGIILLIVDGCAISAFIDTCEARKRGKI